MSMGANMDETENGIVPVGSLGIFKEFEPSGFFEGVKDAETARQQVDNMERLKKLMEAAEQYGQYASQYCESEFRLFLKISEIECAEDKLRKPKREMVAWLRGKSESEIEELLEQCRDGVRIHVIYNRETRGERERFDITKDCDRIAREIVAEAKRSGRTTLTKATFYERSAHPERLTNELVRAYTESTRDALLNRKILGLGDGNGTYVSPEKCDRQEVAKMVKTRLESIVADLKTIKQICKDTGFIVPRQGTELICKLINSLNDDTDVINISM